MVIIRLAVSGLVLSYSIYLCKLRLAAAPPSGGRECLGKLERVWGKAPNGFPDGLVHFGTGKSYIFK